MGNNKRTNYIYERDAYNEEQVNRCNTVDSFPSYYGNNTGYYQTQCGNSQQSNMNSQYNNSNGYSNQSMGVQQTGYNMNPNVQHNNTNNGSYNNQSMGAQQSGYNMSEPSFGNNRYINEHYRNNNIEVSQSMGQPVDNNRREVTNASSIANGRRVTNDVNYSQYNGTYNSNMGYNPNNNSYNYNNNMYNQTPVPNGKTKTKRAPLKPKTIAFITFLALLTIIIVTMIVVNCLPTVNAQDDNGQNNINQVYDESVLNKHVDSEGNVVDINNDTANSKYEYDTKTNWFDNLCDWMEKIGG